MPGSKVSVYVPLIRFEGYKTGTCAAVASQRTDARARTPCTVRTAAGFDHRGRHMANISFGERVRRARIRNAMTQADLGSKLGVTGATISNWETGKINPNQE